MQGMNKVPSPWQETPQEAMVRLRTPMERTKHRSSGALRRFGGGVILAATLATGANWFVGQADNSVGADTHLPTEAQKSAMERGIAGMKAKEKQGTTSTTETPETPPTSIHRVVEDDSAWKIAQDAHDQGLIDGDIRLTVDDIQAQVGPDGLQPNDKVTVHLDHPVSAPR